MYPRREEGGLLLLAWASTLLSTQQQLQCRSFAAKPQSQNDFGLLQLQQIDERRKTPCRSFASNSQSTNHHFEDPRVNQVTEQRERAGQRPPPPPLPERQQKSKLGLTAS
jgi:hypothetical protein